MSKTEFEFDGLEELDKNLAQIIEKQYPEEFKAMIVRAAGELDKRVKGLTPVKNGNLQKSWDIGKVVKEGDTYSVEVYTNTEYAAPVEYGHRAGSRFVKGKHMMQISLSQINQLMPSFLEEWIDDFLAEHPLL
ncbi:MAG: HK97 gp10 family phage protein [Oscillospiraceae bacterium]